MSENIYLSFCIFNGPIRQSIIVLKVTAGTSQPINSTASVYSIWRAHAYVLIMVLILTESENKHNYRVSDMTSLSSSE